MPMRSPNDTFLAAGKIVFAANDIAMKITNGGSDSVGDIGQGINKLSGEVGMNISLCHQSIEDLEGGGG